MTVNFEKNLAEPLSLFFAVALDDVLVDGTKRQFGFVFTIPERYPFNVPSVRSILYCDSHSP